VARILDVRLIVVTDRTLAAPRTIIDVAGRALDGGAPAIQLRDKDVDAATLLQTARALLPLVRAAGALLFINDRVDVALASDADGVHLGSTDLPVSAARRIVPADFFVGFSTDDPGAARQAEADGASYIGCGAVFGTTTKREAAGEAIGVNRVDEVARAVRIPVVGIGGITAANVHELAATRAAGAAAVGAVMAAADPAEAARALLQAFA
jgi:thiamine-phosphate pyrophosphorylase